MSENGRVERMHGESLSNDGQKDCQKAEREGPRFLTSIMTASTYGWETLGQDKGKGSNRPQNQCF